MRRSPAFPFWCALLTVSLGVGRTAAQGPKKSDKLIIDHAGRTARYGGKELEDGDQIRSINKAVEVVVENSNSALYDCQVSTTKTSMPEVDAALGFLKALGPYLIEAAVMRKDRMPPLKSQLAPSTDRGKHVEKELEKINAALLAPDGLHAVFTRTTFELERMRALKPGESLNLQSYRDFVGPTCETAKDCVRLRNTIVLASALKTLGEIYGPFAAEIAAKPMPTDKDKELVQQGAAALGDADGLLGLAHGIERLVRRTYSATTTVKCSQIITMSTFSGRDATITVAPSDLSQTVRIANSEPYVLKINARSDWVWRPAVGLSFIAVPKGKYPKFVAQEQNDGNFRVAKSGFTDGRYSYGLVLASSWRCLDWRDRKAHLAFYIPELSVNPSESERAVALGIGLSWRMLKVGVGRAWAKRTTLADTLMVGSTLANAEALAMQDTYGHGRFYWSISIVGLPPFVP